MKGRIVLWIMIASLLTTVPTSLFHWASASWIFSAVPNGDFEIGALCTVPDQWVMKTWDRDGSEPIPGATYIHEVCENDTHYFSGSRSCWLHSRVLDTDGTKTSRYSWTWIESKDWISQPNAAYLRFYVRNIQPSHSLFWGWNCGIYIGFNDTDTHREYDYVIYNNGETLNFNYYNETGIGADGATWYEYIYPIPADIDPSQMRLKIYCVAGDWTFYDPSYFADMNLYVDNVELVVNATPEQYDWPMCGYDSACTSYSPSNAPNINRTAWITDLPGGTIWAYPLVAEGRAFIGAGGYLNAWNETDGSFLWRFRAPEQPGYPATAAAAGGMIFFGTAEPGPRGYIYALNATTGEQIWSFATEGYLAGSPAVVDEWLYFGGYLGSEQGKIYCVNATTGSSIWNYTTQDRTSSIAVAYSKVYASCGHWETSTQAAVYCLDMYNGGLVWSFDTNRDIAGTCAIANGKVYVTASYEGQDCAVFALNATDGNVVWSTTRYSNGQAGRGAVAYGKFFVILGYGASGVYALNETNGDEIWALLGSSGGGPVVADGKVFFARGDPANVFYAVNETTGAVVWSYELGGGVHSSTSAIAHGRVIVADHYEQKLYAFGLPVHNVDTALDYTTIQEAIDAIETLDGHTILVDRGTYYENVVVDKSLSLIGEDVDNTIIDGATGTVMNVTANGVRVTGFTIQKGGITHPDCGICLKSTGNNVSYNIITKNFYGIYLEKSSNNTISKNNLSENNRDGIYLHESSNNTISGNNITANNMNGVILTLNASNNYLFENNITANHAIGIVVDFSSDHNIVSRNNIADNENGIWSDQSSANTMARNNITNNHYGIRLETASNNILSGNDIAKNVDGMYLHYSSNNYIFENNIANNELGILIDDSSNNSIFHNNFIDNTVQVNINAASLNTWDDGYPSGGNYWSDYAGTDVYHGKDQDESGGDWIGDTPYVIDGNNQDNYPWMGKWWYGCWGDINHDGKVNIVDIGIAAVAFGSIPEYPRWNYKADVDCNGKIDILDLAKIAKCFGRYDP